MTEKQKKELMDLIDSYATYKAKWFISGILKDSRLQRDYQKKAIYEIRKIRKFIDLEPSLLQTSAEDSLLKL